MGELIGAVCGGHGRELIFVENENNEMCCLVHSNNNNNDRSITVGLNYAVFSLAMLIMDVDNACLMINSSVIASSPTLPPGSDRAIA